MMDTIRSEPSTARNAGPVHVRMRRTINTVLPLDVAMASAVRGQMMCTSSVRD